MTEDTNKDRDRELFPGTTGGGIAAPRASAGCGAPAASRVVEDEATLPEWVRRPRHPITRGIE